MDLLKERIMQEGRCFPGGILKVDSFVNNQMDPILMMDLAKEFVRLFKDIKYRGFGHRSSYHGGLSDQSSCCLRQEKAA